MLVSLGRAAVYAAGNLAIVGVCAVAAVYAFGMKVGESISKLGKPAEAAGVPGCEVLQLAVGADADSVVGNQRVAKAKAAELASMVKAICARRLSFTRALKSWTTLGRGWSRRIAGVEANGVAMALKAGWMSPPGIVAVTQAEADRPAATSKSQTVTAGSSIVPAVSASRAAGITDVDAATIVALSVVAISLVAFAVYLFNRSSINRDRAAAYAAVTEGATQ